MEPIEIVRFQADVAISSRPKDEALCLVAWRDVETEADAIARRLSPTRVHERDAVLVVVTFEGIFSRLIFGNKIENGISQLVGHIEERGT